MREHQRLEIEVRLEMARFTAILHSLQNHYPMFRDVIDQFLLQLSNLLNEFRDALTSECQQLDLYCPYCS